MRRPFAQPRSFAATLGLVSSVLACGAPATPQPTSEAVPSQTRTKAEAAKDELAKAEADTTSPKARRRRAREALLSDPERAYDEAKASYDVEPHVDALWVMGAAACRLRDGERARFPYEHLQPELRSELTSYCAHKGADLEALVAE